MTSTSAPWWEVIELRDEVKASDGAIDDVQMSLHDAVFGQEGVGAGRTPYADASYYGDITHPTGSLVELMARVAVRLGVPDSTQTSALWRLDQAMGGGKSHGLIGLWHLAAHPEALSRSDLGRDVMSPLRRASPDAETGAVADLGNPRCVVLDCDNTTAAEEDFGPANRLGERFLWRLFDKDGHRYDEFKAHITNKAKMAEALTQHRAAGAHPDRRNHGLHPGQPPRRIPTARCWTWLSCGCLLDVINDVPNCVAVVVMIASDKDNMAMNREGQKTSG